MGKPLIEYLEAVLTAGSSPRTRETYGEAIRRFQEVTGISTVEELKRTTSKHLQEALTKGLDRWKPSTLKLMMIVMRQMVKYLQREKLLASNPFDQLTKIRVPNNVPEWNVLQPGELDQLLGHFEREAMFFEHAVFALLGFHGLRVTELCNLTWDQVFRLGEDGAVISFRGKRNKEVRIHLHPRALSSLERWAGKRRTGRVILNPEGNPCTRKDLLHLISSLTKSVVGHRVTPHGLRATYISDVISRKGIEAARQLGRHESIVTTQRYSRWKILKDDWK